MWIYTTPRTYEYKYYVQVPTVLLRKIHSLALWGFLTAEENMNQKKETIELRGTHSVASFCLVTLEDIAGTRWEVGKRVGGKKRW